MPRLPEIKDKGKGRTRAGTIRASDYGQGRPLPETSIPSPATSSSSLRAKPHSTASTSPGPFSLGEPFEPSIPTVMARPHQLPRRKTAVRAKRLGSPVHILKMTIGEPLSPQKDGESDDELLLIPRGWGYAHWDVSE
ncbi:hypothetical protein JAAARDRAFT_211541 [Jaapia argillacea MUCL 33604]|uniref:Uncharacterized protein n=1 Tax=Jaapia argillacea MUCL 33604 TaxID=933084 RepID=A0A067P734_9AGAM|nr:hypothetical protein JAAARDRAFT_211541 [Jaapia argillacea MUCL 33604]